MTFIEKQANLWIAGDPVQSKIFDSAIDKVSLSETKRHATILWGGIALICAGASCFAHLDGPTTLFDIATSAGLGFSLSATLKHALAYRHANKDAAQAIDTIQTPHERIYTSFAALTDHISSALTKGQIDRDLVETTKRAEMAALTLNKVADAQISKKINKPR